MEEVIKLNAVDQYNKMFGLEPNAEIYAMEDSFTITRKAR